MNRYSLIGLVCSLSFSASIAAQPNDANKTASRNPVSNSKAVKDPEAERVLKERRDNAQSLLINLASDAGRFNDQTLRARTQARIADVLWSADPDRARALFRKAWDSAEIVDQEGQRKLQEDIKQQQARNGGNAAVSGPPNIRGEVLRLAARRDRALGEEFLAKLRTEKQQETNDAADKARPDIPQTPEAIAQRLSLAQQLLDTLGPEEAELLDDELAAELDRRRAELADGTADVVRPDADGHPAVLRDRGSLLRMFSTLRDG